MANYKRKHFLINKPLQLRYMAYLTVTLITISVVSLLSLYLGIWGGVLDAFSDKRIRDEMLIASQLTQYDEARTGTSQQSLSSLSLFKQSEKLSERQREVFKEILKKSNRSLLLKLLALFLFIAWGSIYISHKIAGPLYRFSATLDEMAKGNVSLRVHLRKSDEAQVLADHFNEALAFLDTTLSKIKNIVSEHDKNPEQLGARLKTELDKIKTSVDK